MHPVDPPDLHARAGAHFSPRRTQRGLRPQPNEKQTVKNRRMPGTAFHARRPNPLAARYRYPSATIGVHLCSFVVEEKAKREPQMDTN